MYSTQVINLNSKLAIRIRKPVKIVRRKIDECCTNEIKIMSYDLIDA